MKKYSGETHVNVGTGEDITIRDVTSLVAETVGFKGDIVNDTTKPDGTPRKLLNTGKLKALGWQPRISLRDGLASTYRWFLENRA